MNDGFASAYIFPTGTGTDQRGSAEQATDVLTGSARWSCECGDALVWLRSLPERSCSLVFFSPPYEGQRTYGIKFKRTGQVWVDWMREIVKASCRASSGLVIVNMASPVKDHKYSPAVEWLVADLTRLDGIACGPSPYAWVKSVNDPEADGNATPGSGGKHYQRRDWEPIYTFAISDRLPLAWSDNTAFGKAPKYRPGGAFSNRDADGTRVNDPWKTASRGGMGCGGRRANGEMMKGPKSNPPGPSRRSNGEMKAVKRTYLGKGMCNGVEGTTKGGILGRKTAISRGHDENGDMVTEIAYLPPDISNPGNVIRAPVGGGKLGCSIAHEGEAPMSIHVATRFVCWFAAPDSVVCDPFVGTGTTAEAAYTHGRRFIGVDLRQSQVDLTARRMKTVTPAMFV